MRSGWLALHHLAVEATSMQQALLPLYLAEGKHLIFASWHHIHCWILIKDIYRERHLVSQFPSISRSAFVKLQCAYSESFHLGHHTSRFPSIPPSAEIAPTSTVQE